MPSALPRLLHAVGEAPVARVEDARHEERIDHVWITMQVGLPAPLTISVNTYSLRSQEAGFDPRVRVGLVRGHWNTLPTPIIEPCDGFDYAKIEEQANVYYEPYERIALEALLLDLTQRSLRIEAWGTSYRQHRRLGLHQIHSRRASSAIHEEMRNADGALRFHFHEDCATTLLLLKFCGQL